MANKDDLYEAKIGSSKNNIVKIGEKFRHVYIYSTFNCKLKVLEGADTFHSLPKESQRDYARVISNQISDGKGLFVHVIHEKYIKTLEEYFNLAYCVQVPIGYQGGYQLHALFYNDKFKYSDRINEEGCKLWT